MTRVVGAPLISGISATPNSSGAVVEWTTDIVSSSEVEYGISQFYTASTTESDTSTRVFSHSVTLSNLIHCTSYHYKVYSKNASLDLTVSEDKDFLTLGCIGSASVIKSATSLILVSSGGSVSHTNSYGRGVTLTVPSAVTSTSSEVIFEIKEIDPEIGRAHV